MNPLINLALDQVPKKNLKKQKWVAQDESLSTGILIKFLVNQLTLLRNATHVFLAGKFVGECSYAFDSQKK